MFRLTIAIVMGSVLFASSVEAESPSEQAIALQPGPHLFIDDHLIAESENVVRRVNQPKRFLDGPVVSGAPEHRNWQPWLTVLHDPSRPPASQFRMWYCADVIEDTADMAYETKVGYLESADGVHWPGPYRQLEHLDNILFGACVLDDGPGVTVPAERYKLMYYRHPYGSELNRPPEGGEPSGPAVAFSPDGLEWATYNGGQPIVPPPSPGADSWHAAYDSLRSRYFLIGKTNQIHEWTNLEGQQLKKRIRLYGTSFSPDFKHWSEFERLFAPDEKDPGVTEWYGMVGFQVRGDLIVAFLQVLRDDLTAEGAPQQAIDMNFKRAGAGMGHTVLCWSRDGRTWHRDRQKDAFFEPNARVGSWDHAMAWVSTVAPVGDELFLYYGGYRWGHKYNRATDRQVGLLKMPRDRYVARHADADGGTFTTPLVTLEGDKLALNADAAQGEIRVEILDAAGQPIPGFTAADCQPITADGLSSPVTWNPKSLAELRGQPVRLRFQMRSASLFALEVE